MAYKVNIGKGTKRGSLHRDEEILVSGCIIGKLVSPGVEFMNYE